MHSGGTIRSHQQLPAAAGTAAMAAPGSLLLAQQRCRAAASSAHGRECFCCMRWPRSIWRYTAQQCRQGRHPRLCVCTGAHTCSGTRAAHSRIRLHSKRNLLTCITTPVICRDLLLRAGQRSSAWGSACLGSQNRASGRWTRAKSCLQVAKNIRFCKGCKSAPASAAPAWHSAAICSRKCAAPHASAPPCTPCRLASALHQGQCAFTQPHS